MVGASNERCDVNAPIGASNNYRHPTNLKMLTRVIKWMAYNGEGALAEIKAKKILMAHFDIM